jgi:hypothetical protein
MTSVAPLLPLVNDLSKSDKLALLKLLATQIPEADLQVIFSATEYPICSPYGSTEVADILMQMIKDDQQASAHA